MQRRYITVDVFTDRAFGGNPLAVVLDAGGLSTAQMQAIASEFNYSETTFVLPPHDPAHDAQVRIFTVRSEIPFAGHPNVGTAFVLATLAAKPPARLLFEEKAGLVPVEVVIGAGQRRRRRTDCAAAAEAACRSSARSRRRPACCCRRERHQDRPPCAADRLGRTAVPGGRTRLARGAAAGAAGRRGVRKDAFRATAAMRSISIRAMCRPTKSPATCRRGCFIPAPADCRKTRRPAARPPPLRRCSPILIPRGTAN